MSLGHQRDHTVGYTYGSASDVIKGVIPLAADAWNRKMKMGLLICDGSDDFCKRTKNSDGFLVTVLTVMPSSPGDTTTGCGDSYACLDHTGDLLSAPSGVGSHMTSMEMVFEDPPYVCTMPYENPCADEHQRILRWTADPGKDRTWISENGTRILLLYPLRVAIHEFGHTLGLPDFYAHTEWGLFTIAPRLDGLSGETAIMNTHDTVTDSDIAQLDAIYRLHSRH